MVRFPLFRTSTVYEERVLVNDSKKVSMSIFSLHVHGSLFFIIKISDSIFLVILPWYYLRYVGLTHASQLF